MRRMRVIDLAKELHLTPKEVIEAPRRHGTLTTSFMSSLDDELQNTAREILTEACFPAGPEPTPPVPLSGGESEGRFSPR